MASRQRDGDYSNERTSLDDRPRESKLGYLYCADAIRWMIGVELMLKVVQIILQVLSNVESTTDNTGIITIVTQIENVTV